MAVLTVYLRGMNKEQVKDVRQRLNEMAAEQGYYCAAGPRSGKGNFGALIVDAYRRGGKITLDFSDN